MLRNNRYKNAQFGMSMNVYKWEFPSPKSCIILYNLCLPSECILLTSRKTKRYGTSKLETKIS